jgi:hypothetical protein
MPLQGIGQFGEMFQTEATGLVNPAIQEGGAEFCVGQIPKCAQVLFEQISGVEGFIGLHEHHEPFKGAWFEVFQGSEQQEAAAFDELFVCAAEFSGHIPSGRIDGPVDDRHHVVGVMDNIHTGEHLAHGLHVIGGHIHGYGSDFGSLAFEPNQKRDQGIGIFALMGMQDVAGFKIEHDGHVVMTLADREFIHRQIANLVQLSLSKPS